MGVADNEKKARSSCRNVPGDARQVLTLPGPRSQTRDLDKIVKKFRHGVPLLRLNPDPDGRDRKGRARGRRLIPSKVEISYDHVVC